MFFKHKRYSCVRLPANMQAPKSLPPVTDYTKYESPTYLRKPPKRAATSDLINEDLIKIGKNLPAFLTRQAD